MANLSFLNALIKCSIDCPSMCNWPINVQCPQCLPQCMLYEICFGLIKWGVVIKKHVFSLSNKCFESLNPLNPLKSKLFITYNNITQAWRNNPLGPIALGTKKLPEDNKICSCRMAKGQLENYPFSQYFGLLFEQGNFWSRKGNINHVIRLPIGQQGFSRCC